MRTFSFIFLIFLPFMLTHSTLAEISSKAYVDEKISNTNEKTLQYIIGREDYEQAKDFDTLEDEEEWYLNEGVLYAAIRNTLANITGSGTKNAVITTDNDGKIKRSRLGNNNLREDASIGLKKLELPVIPNECKGTGGSCILMYNGEQDLFVWEVVSRGNGATVPSTGGVTGNGGNTNASELTNSTVFH